MNLGTCPFCGTEIKNGATVCTGCQANYRARGFDGFITFMLGCMSLISTYGALMQATNKQIVLGLFLGAIAVMFIYFFYKWVSKRSWYRYMH